MARKKIKGNMANIITYLGSLYRNPADALKEYVSNAVDEWRKARDKREMEGPCEVTYSLEKGRITIDYNSPGMDDWEFEEALNKVADSVKLGLTVPQIGQLGIGIFAFNQVGTHCSFYSKKAKGSPTVKVTLAKQSDEYQIETAIKRESRKNAGMTIVISGLHHDPLKTRGPLGAERLQRVFGEKFDSYLREGDLRITISSHGKFYEVKPLEISLSTVGKGFGEVHLSADWQKEFRCQFWFDPSGKSKVSIRHTGVPVVEDVRLIQAYGLEESAYASGFLKGYIDADFLKPLPARTGFEENQDWIQFLAELDKIRPSIEDEVEELRIKEEEKRLTQIQRKAIQLAREILDQQQFRGLGLLGGLSKKRGPITKHPGAHPGTLTGTRSRTAGDVSRSGGMRIAFAEVPFEDGASRHSRFLSGTVQVNMLNQDYKREMAGTEQAKLSYATLMIGKETIAYNDDSKAADDFLEKLLSFLFEVRARIGKSPATVSKRPPGRPRKTGTS
jgi:hypothetical protein